MTRTPKNTLEKTVLIVVVLLLSKNTVFAQSPARSVESFLGLKVRWEKLVNVPFKIEGRYSSIGGKLLRFQNCDLSFRSLKPFPKLTGTSNTIEVSGKLRKEKGRLYFEVEKVRELSDDLQRLRSRKRNIPKNKPEEWYQLGSWALGRGKFYEDKQLTKEAEEIYLEGVQHERQQLPKNNSVALLALAKKIADFPISYSLRYEFIHEAYQKQWKSMLGGEPDEEQIEAFKKQIEENLPASKTPLEKLQPEFHKQYLDDPLKTYIAGDIEQRQLLHRHFFIEVSLKLILKDSKDDGSNGFEIAEKIDELLPEKSELAEKYRDKELMFKLSNVGNYSRRDMLALNNLFKERDDNNHAKETRVAWLLAREKLLRRDGPTGLLKLAEEYIELAEDEATAAKFLIEAYKLTPEGQEISDRLKKLGYRLHQGEWISEATTKLLATDEIEKAIHAGRVTVGMDPDQVRKTLGAPLTVSRSVTSGQVSEIWIYGPRNTSRLAIHFIRNSSRSSQTATVTAILQLKLR